MFGEIQVSHLIKILVDYILIKTGFRALLAGGGAPEIEISLKLAELARSVTGVDAYCYKAFAQALEVIPLTLAENAGLNPITTVTELRNRHAQGEITAGINVRKVTMMNNAYRILSVGVHPCVCCMYIV